ncbi:MAG: formylmethanofuran dehydrogenase subunit A [Rhodospirillaceae bacterium]|jgi:formylmethanofuran dehydrogenase subunit A|nr:formylmethanofuran dehydrogenase subunit A [Rhodospirillaceae bacterium]MBT5373348.1 formylmethanofuran dehydrogenase subunit A [Rhodospirillaceae bacterium]MBT5659253.1 formylmethanofuran dehydrogenase subunit A [Rhodospirillaceae bacterium]MBT5751704.1 formylmethanofuran dehydrogenase subunit A [Rhodospirillaceae bacterium]
MLIRLKGGRVYDPANKINGKIGDIYVRNGRVVSRPGTEKPDQVYDLSGKIVMAGAIDLHSHIAGGKLNIARILLPEEHRDMVEDRTRLKRSGSGEPTMTSFTTGYRYAEMGYTAAFEPAMVPVNARQCHLEMADIPIIDKGCYAMIGNDDFFLRMLAAKKDKKAIRDYVAWMMNATGALGVKVVNPGGISAFKFNGRKLDLDEKTPHYGVTPREVLLSLAGALEGLGVPHPLHVHGCNLGVPGNVETTLDTIAGTGGLPMHLTHIQFHSYGAEGDRKFSSGAARIAEAINKNKNITADVGQIMFGQTVTASGDTMAQHAHSHLANPKKWVCMDIDCQAGCGLVPFRYRDKDFVNALQWAIGLETFLLVDDPWRIFLTTDHPNGAPFTSYPHLIRLLMDRSFRNDMLATVNKHARVASNLGAIKREYSLNEIAIMTRAAPARILGLKDRGHLAVGAAADITVYSEHANKEKMFSKPDYVFKDGQLVARNGRIVDVVWGTTHVVRPEYDSAIERPLKTFFNDYQGIALDNFVVREGDFPEDGRYRFKAHPTKKRRAA